MRQGYIVIVFLTPFDVHFINRIYLLFKTMVIGVHKICSKKKRVHKISF